MLFRSGITSRSWTSSAYTPTERAVSSARESRPGDRRTSWLRALPHSAALLRWHEGVSELEQYNEQFARSFRALVEPRGDFCEQWLLDFHAELAAFAQSDKAVRRFEIERMSPLGVETFLCTLAWVRGDYPVDDRRSEEHTSELQSH